MITIEKDDFTGFKKIYTPIFNLQEFSVFNDVSVMRSSQRMRRLDMKMKHDELTLKIKLGHNVDEQIKKLDSSNLNGFDLIYIEGEDGQGIFSIRVYSALFEDGNWPSWYDEWPMIVDGERVSITSNHVTEHPIDLEFKVYNLPVDVFSKLSNAQEIKYSLRGKSDKIEGVLKDSYIKVFKAFEQLCFGDENEGQQMFDSLELEKNKYKGFLEIFGDDKNDQEESTTYSCFSCKANNIVPNSWDSFSCHKCKKENTVIRPKNLSDEERSNHENKVIDLVKDKKVEDAIKYYAANFGFSENDSKSKVKEIAEKNGLASNYKKYETKSAIIGFAIIAVVLFVLFKACS